MHTYTKFALSRLYFPEAVPETANRHLARWINQCQPLKKALADTGYSVRQRHFTARQTQLIFEYLGEP